MSDVLDLVEFDWLVATHWTVLHHAALTSAQADDLEHEGNVEHVWLTCGRLARTVMVPGILSRMSLRRCATCCKRRGIPQGWGSPKNDQACRAVLRRDGFIGLDTPQHVDLRDQVAGWREMPQEMKDERHRRLNSAEVA